MLTRRPLIGNQVNRQYDQLAASYDQRWQAYLHKTLAFLRSWANLSLDTTVLDVGCGTGLFEQLVLADHPTQAMVGIDLSSNMLEIAQQRLAAQPPAQPIDDGTPRARLASTIKISNE